MHTGKQKYQGLRLEYLNEPLDKESVDDNPFLQFEYWFQEALNAGVPEPNAMTLATVSLSGKPSARVVLLKGIQDGGFIFYTNFNSRKGIELSSNPNAALVFCWLELARQVRVEGVVQKVAREESCAYFQSRPRNSQIGALVSSQSEIIEDRSYLEDEMARLELQFRGKDAIPCPEHWGGFVLFPSKIEFWQGRPSRLHDRICYSKEQEDWNIYRLAP